MTKLKKRQLKSAEELLEKWKLFYSSKRNPKTTGEKIEEWERNAYLWRSDKNALLISGGGRILLWLVYCEGGWKKHFAELIQRGQFNNYLESLKFRYRERVLGIDMLKKVNKRNYQKLIDDGVDE